MDHFVQNIIKGMPAPVSIQEHRHHAHNASVLADLYDEHIAHSAQLGWMYRVTGGHWREGEDECAKAVAEQLVTNALLTTGTHLEGSNISSTVAALQRLVTVPARFWDQNLDVVGLPNGRVLNLTTGESRPVRADDYLTRTIGVEHDPEAKAPLFEKSLAEWLPNEADRLLVQAYAGYCMTGRTDAHAFLLTTGYGRNGKGTLMHQIEHILGDYAMELPQDSLTGTTHKHDSWKMPLRYARMASIADLPPSNGWRAPLIKTLTGGDRINANYMRKDPIWFRPTAKLWIGANEKPIVRGDDKALQARMLMVDFPNRFEVNPDLGDQLRAEAQGVLNWMIEGAVRYYAEGLPKQTDDSAEAKATYFSDSDVYEAYLDSDFIEAKADAFATNDDLRRSWVSFQQDLLGNEHASVFTNLAKLKGELAKRGGKLTQRRVVGKALPRHPWLRGQGDREAVVLASRPEGRLQLG